MAQETTTQETESDNMIVNFLLGLYAFALTIIVFTCLVTNEILIGIQFAILGTILGICIHQACKEISKLLNSN
jgi:hypothetical protein